MTHQHNGGHGTGDDTGEQEIEEFGRRQVREQLLERLVAAELQRALQSVSNHSRAYTNSREIKR